MLKIDKELFQWEKERYIIVMDSTITHVQFYNREDGFAQEVRVVDGKA